MLEQKLATLQRLLASTQEASESSWQVRFSLLICGYTQHTQHCFRKVFLFSAPVGSLTAFFKIYTTVSLTLSVSIALVLLLSVSLFCSVSPYLCCSMSVSLSLSLYLSLSCCVCILSLSCCVFLSLCPSLSMCACALSLSLVLFCGSTLMFLWHFNVPYGRSDLIWNRNETSF